MAVGLVPIFLHKKTGDNVYSQVFCEILLKKKFST